MNNTFVLYAIMAVAMLLTSCHDAEPSNDYPNGILFQNIDIFINDNSIQVSTDLSSSGDIYLSDDKENQFLTINNNEQYPLKFITRKDDGDQETNITTIDTETLPAAIQSNDEIKVVFSRSNGSELESVANVPENINYITPLANAVYDHSTEDLVISWQSQSITNRLFLTGDCLAYDSSTSTETKWDYYYQVAFPLIPEQTSITIPANSLLSVNNDNTQCEVTISLFPISYGYIDENLAGGTFKLQKQSNLHVTLTSLQAAYDE